MFNLQDFEDNEFLPEETDKLKAQIKEFQRRLETATKREKELRKELIEEDLSYVTISNLTKLIQDPTRIVEFELNEMQKEILDKLLYTAEICCVREIISYHRLSGRSIFKFKGNYNCIRLETYYDKSYKEPYYIIYMNDRLIQQTTTSLIQHHTIPPFIHLDSLEKQFLPHSFETFIRIIHQQIQAYVTKREILKQVTLNPLVKLIYQSDSLYKIELQIMTKTKLHFLLLFKDKSSSYPTDISFYNHNNEIDLFHIEQEFKYKPFHKVIQDLINNYILD